MIIRETVCTETRSVPSFSVFLTAEDTEEAQSAQRIFIKDVGLCDSCFGMDKPLGFTLRKLILKSEKQKGNPSCLCLIIYAPIVAN